MTQPKQTLEQKRASDALEKVMHLKEREYGNYVSYVSSLPADIVMTGLGQALATLLAQAKGKKDDPHRLLYNHLASWLASHVPELQGDTENLIHRLMQNSESVYLHAQAEAIAYINWLKQFARAYLNEKKEQ